MDIDKKILNLIETFNKDAPQSAYLFFISNVSTNELIQNNPDFITNDANSHIYFKDFLNSLLKPHGKSIDFTLDHNRKCLINIRIIEVQ